MSVPHVRRRFALLDVLELREPGHALVLVAGAAAGLTGVVSLHGLPTSARMNCQKDLSPDAYGAGTVIASCEVVRVDIRHGASEYALSPSDVRR